MSRISFAHFSPLARTRVSALALAAAAALLLSGCQGGSTPANTGSTTASPTSSATPTPSPTPTAAYKPADAKGKAQNVPVPVMPSLAKENTKEGLEAFVRYWYATYSYAMETGDLAPWISTTDTSTAIAAAYKKAIELNYVKGRWLVGGRITTPVVEVMWVDGADQQSAKVQVIQERTQYYDADGSVGQAETPAANIAEAVFSRFIDGAWRVTDNGKIVG
ncbi:DUF6318 family protein [Arthrobacter sp. CJ23]|uniref:DUF6318 family protein n=1 Tax=Arthrobacter sp. CJ23 TaxID=2972479 RepID=UPI00215CD865|nr:DUF6318 family protein [Arthrobacter sp. CJ23]UVJ39334.1 DUF6318 family protein [Arthrobacter sp. CJ23]